MEIIEEKVSQEFIEQYADEIFTASNTANPNTPIKVIKHLCKIQVDCLIQRMTEHEDVIEFLNNVKQVIENKQE